MKGRRLVRSLPIALTLVVATSGAALATVPLLELAQIAAERDSRGWSFVAELEGRDFTNATLVPPSGPPIAMTCEGLDFAGVECAFEHAGFPSLAALLGTYPAGEYALSLDGGNATALLPFGPVEPNGTIAILEPLDGSAEVSPTPAIVYAHDCTNCVALGFEIVDLDGDEPVELELVVFGEPPAFSGAIPYAALEPFEGATRPDELPDGRYALTAFTAVGAILELVLAPGDTGFDYATGAFLTTRTTFVVPEPAAFATALAAFATLGTLARRRPRGRTATRACPLLLRPDPGGSRKQSVRWSGGDRS